MGNCRQTYKVCSLLTSPVRLFHGSVSGAICERNCPVAWDSTVNSV